MDERTKRALIALIFLDRHFESLSAAEKRAAIEQIVAPSIDRHPGGRPLGADKYRQGDFRRLYEIDRRYEAEGGQKAVFAAIKKVVEEKWEARIRPGASPDAIARRLFARLRPTVLRTGVTKLIMTRGEFENFPIARRVRPLKRRQLK
jgi:hypothetical protein